MDELIENLHLEEMNYYYHITSKGFGNEIIENGLYLEKPDLITTTIKLPNEFINYPIEYCISEYSNGLVKRQEMVIIGCNKGEERFLINQTEISKCVENQKLNYVIDCENILGYIDLKTLEIVFNPQYMDFNLTR